MTSTNEFHRGQKYCAHCKKWLSVNQFHQNRAKADGLSSYCKDGMKKVVNESRKKHPFPRRDL